MTITTNPSRDEYTSSPGQTVFNYTFKIYESTDLNVYVTPEGQEANDAADISTDYTVDTNTIGNDAGGFITFDSPLNDGDLVTIVSDIPTDRTTDYQANGDFIPETVNNDFDRTVSLVKQVENLATRTIQFQESQQSATGITLPAPNPGDILQWNDAGDGFNNTDGSGILGIDQAVADAEAARDAAQQSEANAAVSEANAAASAQEAAAYGKLRRVILGTGQSNALGNNIGGDTSVNNEVFAWNNVGQSWEVAELGKEPFRLTGENNLTLQAARELQMIEGGKVYLILVAQGGLSIDNWLPGAPTTDMFARIQSEVSAALAAGGFASNEPLEAVIWSQGESDDSLAGFFDYTNKFRQVFNRFDSEPWFSRNTKVATTMLAHNANGDRANIGFRYMGYANEAPYPQLVNSEFLPTSDGVHFTGPSLTDIGKSCAKVISGGDAWQSELTIDRQVTVQVPSEIAELGTLFEIFSEWKFTGLGELTIELTDIVTPSRAIQVRHPQGERFLIKGQFAGGKTAPPIDSDFTGTFATDVAMVKTFYDYYIDTTGITAIVVGANSGLRLEETAIIGDQALASVGIDMRDQLSRVGGGSVGIDNVTVIGFEAQGIRANGGDIHELTAGAGNTIAHCGVNVYAEASHVDLSALTATWADSYNIYSLEGSTVNIPNCEIHDAGLYGILCEINSYAYCESGNFSGNATNDVRVRKGSETYVHGATTPGGTSPAITTDAVGFDIVTV